MEFTVTFLKLFGWVLHLASPLLFLLCAIIIILGQIVTYIEKWNKFDGLYWSFITATTVGYGDIRPLKKRSKILSIFIALTGMIFTGLIIATAVKVTAISIEKFIEPETIEKFQNVIGD